MNKPTIYFDGVCGLCNGFIDFVMSVDKKDVFRFSPLQSEYARNNLPDEFTNDIKSIVVQFQDKTYTKSAAVMTVLNQLGGLWKFLSIAKVLPESISNKVYDFVAENRYELFGKKETCRLPTPQERAKFIL